MYDLRIEHSGANSYLVQQVGTEDSLDMLSLGMITNNNIQGIIPVRYIQENERKYLRYDISHKGTAENIFMVQGMYSKVPKRLLDVLLEISSTFLRAEDYMIDLSLFLLELNYIYINVSTNETSLLCIPITAYGRPPLDLATFFMRMVTHVQWARTEKETCIQAIVRSLKDLAAFSLAGFYSALESLKQEYPQQEVWKNEFANSLSEPSPQIPAEASPNNDEIDKIKENQGKAMGHVAWTRVPLNQNQPEFPVASKNQDQVGSSSELWVRTELSAPMSPNQRELEPSATPVSQEQAESRIQTWNQPELSAPMSSNQRGPESPAVPVSQAQAESRIQTWNQPELSAPMSSNWSAEPPTITKIQGWKQPQFSVPSMSQNQNSPESQSQISPPAPPFQDREQHEPQAVLGSPSYDQPAGSPKIQGEISFEKESPGVPFILRHKTMEKFVINKPVFKIGKAKNEVDYCIEDNRAISRSHAKIITSDGHYYIVDMGSTNHTYVDGCEVQSHVMKEIFHGSVLRFADEDFDFMWYHKE